MTDQQKKFSLNPEQIDLYKENGYLLAEGVFTREEAAFFRRESHDLIARLLAAQEPGTEGNIRNEGWASGAKITDLPRELLHCHNVQFHSSAFTRLIADPRLTDRVADLIGPNIQLHHTKMFIKPPEKGAPFPMHQDVPYFPHEKHTMMAAVIHFDDAPVEKGCVRVVPGSHNLGPLKHLNDGGYHLPIATYPVDQATPCPARAGDVLFFSYLTIHGSTLNTSGEARTTLLVQLRDPVDLPLAAVHLSRGQGMMMRGVDPLVNAAPSVSSDLRFAPAAR